MTMTATPIFAQTPIVAIATLTSPTAITSRANITGVTGLVKLTDTTTNGLRVDGITVKGKGTSVSGEVYIWLYDGTTSYLIEEIDISAVTGSATLASFIGSKYPSGWNLKPTQQLYVSVSTVQDVNVFAFGGAY